MRDHPLFDVYLVYLEDCLERRKINKGFQSLAHISENFFINFLEMYKSKKFKNRIDSIRKSKIREKKINQILDI